MAMMEIILYAERQKLIILSTLSIKQNVSPFFEMYKKIARKRRKREEQFKNDIIKAHTKNKIRNPHQAL